MMGRHHKKEQIQSSRKPRKYILGRENSTGKGHRAGKSLGVQMAEVIQVWLSEKCKGDSGQD